MQVTRPVPQPTTSPVSPLPSSRLDGSAEWQVETDDVEAEPDDAVDGCRSSPGAIGRTCCLEPSGQPEAGEARRRSGR